MVIPAAPAARRASRPATSLAGSETTGARGSDAQSFDVGHDHVPVRVQPPVGAGDVPRLGHGDGHDGHLGPAQVVQELVVLGRGVHRRQRADQLERVAVAAPGDQRVEAVLGGQRLRHIGSPTGEGRDPPLVGVGGMGGVPGLVGPVEVADPEVHDPNRRCGWAARARPGQSDGLGVVTPLVLFSMMLFTA